MLYWIPYAFVRIAVCFIAGIVLGLVWPPPIDVRILWIALIFLIGSYFALCYLRRNNRRKYNPGIIGLAAVFVAGYLNIFLETDTNDPSHLTHFTSPYQHYEAVVIGFSQEKESSFKEVVRVRKVKTEAGWIAAKGKVLLYLPKREFNSTFEYGDILLIKGHPSVVNGPANPGEFDYRKFLSYSNIFHQHSIKSSEVTRVSNDPPSRLLAASISTRDWVEQRIKNVVHGKREQAIACALVLGITEGLDNDLMGAYAATGALHVLSVSGLHVGILYLVIITLLRPLEKRHRGKWIASGIAFLSLWFYACLTGLSPSVLRAVTMFSFMLVAKPMGQRTDIYNILAASAFLLLLFDPYLIMSMGFQLSYLALLGIVYAQPILYNLYVPQSRVVDEVWKITTVSIGAQLGTAAPALYYFHQFPNYFLLSNFYVLPLGFAILVGGLIVVAVSFIPVVAGFAGMLLEWIIWLMNYLTLATESLPYSVISGIHFDIHQCIIAFAMFISMMLFIQYRRKSLLVVAGVSFIMISAIAVLNQFKYGTDPKITVYNVSKKSAFDITYAGTVYSFLDSSLINDPGKVAYHISPGRLMNYGAHVLDGKDQPFVRELPFGSIMHCNGKVILHLKSPQNNIPGGLIVDYLIVSNNSVSDLDKLLQKMQCHTVIVDSSNSFKFVDKLVKNAALNNIAIHSVWHHGAFQKNI